MQYLIWRFWQRSCRMVNEPFKFAQRGFLKVPAGRRPPQANDFARKEWLAPTLRHRENKNARRSAVSDCPLRYDRCEHRAAGRTYGDPVRLMRGISRRTFVQL